jgi:hypothetical protein
MLRHPIPAGWDLQNLKAVTATKSAPQSLKVQLQNGEIVIAVAARSPSLSLKADAEGSDRRPISESSPNPSQISLSRLRGCFVQTLHRRRKLFRTAKLHRF